MDEKIYTLGFSAFIGIGTIRFEKLLATFGSAENAWQADSKKIEKAIGPLTAKRFDEFRNKFDIEKYAEEIAQKEIHYFVPQDTEYPVLLKKIDHPPFILFAKGNVALLSNDRTIGIVGTRKVTPYGSEVTRMFTKELVEQHMVIVSGMALGVDGIAHQTVLENKGATIAVLGSGVDVPTPREHTHLYNRILENNGVIVSTFSPGEDASVGSFPARNAIIAGLSQGVLITEGAEDSGALITAKDAKTYNRPIFAVPGQITSHLSEGPNNLIKEGAIPVSNAQEILDKLNLSLPIFQPKHAVQSTIPQEQEILNLLQEGSLYFNDIVRKLQKDSSTIGSLLSLMELKGLIHQSSDGTYSL